MKSNNLNHPHSNVAFSLVSIYLISILLFLILLALSMQLIAYLDYQLVITSTFFDIFRIPALTNRLIQLESIYNEGYTILSPLSILYCSVVLILLGFHLMNRANLVAESDHYLKSRSIKINHGAPEKQKALFEMIEKYANKLGINPPQVYLFHALTEINSYLLPSEDKDSWTLYITSPILRLSPEYLEALIAQTLCKIANGSATISNHTALLSSLFYSQINFNRRIFNGLTAGAWKVPLVSQYALAITLPIIIPTLFFSLFGLAFFFVGLMLERFIIRKTAFKNDLQCILLIGTNQKILNLINHIDQHKDESISATNIETTPLDSPITYLFTFCNHRAFLNSLTLHPSLKMRYDNIARRYDSIITNSGSSFQFINSFKEYLYFAYKGHGKVHTLSHDDQHAVSQFKSSALKIMLLIPILPVIAAIFIIINSGFSLAIELFFRIMITTIVFVTLILLIFGARVITHLPYRTVENTFIKLLVTALFPMLLLLSLWSSMQDWIVIPIILLISISFIIISRILNKFHLNHQDAYIVLLLGTMIILLFIPFYMVALYLNSEIIYILSIHLYILLLWTIDWWLDYRSV